MTGANRHNLLDLIGVMYQTGQTKHQQASNGAIVSIEIDNVAETEAHRFGNVLNEDAKLLKNQGRALSRVLCVDTSSTKHLRNNIYR